MKPGTRIGPYEIVREIGAGAMGEVVLARDDRLDRQVALKSLPDAFAADAERLARFEREARMLAALHHPHVASLFGLEEFDGRRYLVMEFVEGETLAQRIARGVVDLGEATKLAEQIARGLAAAHDKGIIHRDLKPGNVLVTPGGQAKVVDFGLAKDVARSAVEDSGLFSDLDVENAHPDISQYDITIVRQEPSDAPSDHPGDDIELAPTVLADSSSAAAGGFGSSGDPLATEPGAVLGTAAYMSPEQARGQAVDRRCDVWAFGCVLFEMLARRRPFSGENLMQTLTSVLQEEPPWDALPSYTPPALERLLRRCLRKDPDERLRDLGDAALELSELRSGKLEEPEALAGQRRRRPALALAAAAALAGLALGVLAAVWLREAPEPAPSVRFTLPTPDLDWGVIGESNLAAAPDGRSWVFRSTAGDVPRLMLRRLDEDEAVPIPGTEDAVNPFFSPDGRHLGFTRGTQLLRIEPFTGSARVLVTLDGGGFMGQPSWGEDGRILYSALPQGVFVVDAEGGPPTSVLKHDDVAGTSLLAWPEHVGDDHFAIFTSIEDRLETRLVSWDGSLNRTIEDVESRVIYIEPDLLVFVRDREVLAQQLDAGTATLVGDPVRLATGVAWNSRVGNAAFTLSPSLLVVAQREYRARMQWFDAGSGEALETLGEPADLSTPRISPRGDQVAVAISEISGGAEDLWLFDLERHVGSRITSTGAAESMVAWAPEGERLAYYTDAYGPPDVMVRPTIAGGEVTVLVNWDDAVFPTDWLADGSAVIFHSYPDFDIYLAPLDGSPPRLWYQAVGRQTKARLSPDGTWLAFRSTELGAGEVFIAPLADSDRKIRVSTAGGDTPAWAPDGRSLYFHDRRAVYRVGIDAAAGRVLGAAELIVQLEAPDLIASFDVHPDGRRLLLAIVDEDLKRPKTLVHASWRGSLTNRE